MKTTHLLTTLCAIATAGTLQAQVIGDFENAVEPGWVFTAGSSGTPSTAWSSTGSYSLQLTPGASGFSWALQFNNLSVLQQLVATHYLQVDVHWISAEWLPDTDANGWVRWDIGSVNSGGAMGWKQITDANITDTANPSYPGSWDPNNWGATHTRTLTYDFTTLGYDLSSPGWGAQFNLGINFGNIETIGKFYIDNVHLVAVPEPAGLALLGLGGVLALLRRRSARA